MKIGDTFTVQKTVTEDMTAAARAAFASYLGEGDEDPVADWDRPVFSAETTGLITGDPFIKLITSNWIVLPSLRNNSLGVNWCFHSR